MIHTSSQDHPYEDPYSPLQEKNIHKFLVMRWNVKSLMPSNAQIKCIATEGVKEVIANPYLKTRVVIRYAKHLPMVKKMGHFTNKKVSYYIYTLKHVKSILVSRLFIKYKP